MQLSEKRKDSVGINGIYIFVFRKNFKQKIKHRNRRDKMIRKKESLINEIKNMWPLRPKVEVPGSCSRACGLSCFSRSGNRFV